MHDIITSTVLEWRLIRWMKHGLWTPVLFTILAPHLLRVIGPIFSFSSLDDAPRVSASQRSAILRIDHHHDCLIVGQVSHGVMGSGSNQHMIVAHY